MLKKVLALVLAVGLLTGCITFAAEAADFNITARIDGKTVAFPDAKPFIGQDGKVYCPVRFIAEALGAQVSWTGENETVLITAGADSIKFAVGQSKAVINGKEKELSSKAILVGDRTFAPLTFIGEISGSIVDWDAKTGTVRIDSVKSSNELLLKQGPLNDDERALTEKLDEYLTSLEKYENFHGSVLAAKDGKVLLDKGYGKANFEQGIANTAKTRFAIGSVTKQFTAMAVMQLQEQGKLSTDDKLSKYMPDFPQGNEITLQQLLTHSSGIINYTDLPAFYAMNPASIKPSDIIALLKDKPLEFVPGTTWKYSNSGYFLLGCIVEKVSGTSLDDYLSKNIFEPLNMKDTGICYKNGEKNYWSSGYMGYLDTVPVDDEIVLRGAFGAGYLYSTVEDMYLWDRALNTDKLVQKKTMEAIFTPYIDTKLMGSYGYGWFISNSDLGNEVFHGGNTIGFTSVISRYIDKNLTVIILTNNDGANSALSVYTLKSNLAGIMLGRQYTPAAERKTVSIASDILDSYTGRYEVSPGYYIDIARDGGKVFAQLTGQEKCEIFPASESSFFYRLVKAEINFIRNDKGEVTGLVLNQNGMSLPAKKSAGEPEEKKTVQVDPKVYDSYAGEYELMPGYIIAVSKEDNRIFFQAPGQPKLEMFPESEVKYFLKIADVQITFTRSEKGEVTGAVIQQAGQQLNAKKVK